MLSVGKFQLMFAIMAANSIVAEHVANAGWHSGCGKYGVAILLLLLIMIYNN